ncbi:soluble lamin-associated protein of 75 kDa isoform X3 [Clarias gariepinus]|uniref:soluble lamin-associated protein of 75 kDa isoform X3 n=1 Tax=Clarias gariepinus TaxID=13013 RepID=UPI00234DA741|nr:soluble lamin-associated protein of 75 kDa isoform X3 [Clarias gariepinus]
MEFPVDVLDAMSHGELERSARSYMNELLYADPDQAHYFTLPGGKKVQISLSSVGFVPLYGANLQHKVLALFTPQDQLTAVALFLDNQWYAVEDILKTANSRREGLIKVRAVGERIVLYVLNRIVYRTNEMEKGEMPFLCHSENEHAKIFWKSGQAVGFYSVKPKGTVCNNYLRQCYFLPVMDSIFVRKAHRGKGYGLRMLEDFVDSFNEDELGLKYPLTPAMTNVCRRYLDRYPADVDMFWEVEGIGGPYQRTKVAYKLTTRPLNDAHKGGHAEDNGQNGDIVEDHVEESEETSLNITEEVIKHHKVTEEIDTPVSTRTRSSEHRRRKRVREEEEAKGVDSRPDKINRLEVAEEEQKEIVPDDGGIVESVPKAPTETPTVDVNNMQAKDKTEGAEKEDVQNGTASKEQGEMEVEKLKAPVRKVVLAQDDTQTVEPSEEPAAEQQEEAPVAEDDQEMEVGTLAHVQQNKQDDPASEEKTFPENEKNEVDAQVVPADKKQELDSGAHKELEVASAAHEKQDVAPAAHEEQDASSAAETKHKVSPAAETKHKVSPAAETKHKVSPAAETKHKVSPAAETKHKVSPAAETKHKVSPAAETKHKVSPAAETKHKVSPAAETKHKVSPAAETKHKVSPAAETKHKVSPAAETKHKVSPAAETKHKVSPAAETKHKVSPAAETKHKVSPAAETKHKVSPAAEDEQAVASTVTENQEEIASGSEEEQERAPAAKEKQDEDAVDAEDQEGSSSVEEEQGVASEIENNEPNFAVEEENKVASETKDKEVAHFIEEMSSLGTDSEGETGQDEDMDLMNMLVSDLSEQSFNKEERQSTEEKIGSLLLVEEEEATQKDDEIDEEGEEKNLNDTSDFSKVLCEAITKTVPLTSKRTSKRLSKMVLDEEEGEQERELKGVEDDKGMSTEEEKLTTEEEAEHSSEDEQVHDPPVIDRRVLRRKTKVIQTKQRTRSKRRGKM